MALKRVFWCQGWAPGPTEFHGCFPGGVASWLDLNQLGLERSMAIRTMRKGGHESSSHVRLWLGRVGRATEFPEVTFHACVF